MNVKRFVLLSAMLIACVGQAAGGGSFTIVEGPGLHRPGERTDPCPNSTLNMNHDGSTESAFTWGAPGISEPDYGALAEGYPDLVGGTVCGIELYLTRWGSMNGVGAIDLFVWDYDVATDNPGGVLAVTVSTPVSGVGYWPSVTIHDFDAQDAAVPSHGVFVGYWPRSFVEAPEQFGCAMDVDGSGSITGVPRTNIPPSSGYPTGWHNLTVVGYDIASWGIGPWVAADVTPTRKSSWSAVKLLYD